MGSRVLRQGFAVATGRGLAVPAKIENWFANLQIMLEGRVLPDWRQTFI
jgi:hypothetical protein